MDKSYRVINTPAFSSYLTSHSSGAAILG